MLMRTNLWLLAGVSSMAFAAAALPTGALAQGAPALTGVVSSAEEGNMEGVLVSAKKEGTTITVTVASDDKGNFSFPADRLSPGKYQISIRASGYVLSGPKEATITAGQTTKADVKLGRAKNVVGTLSNAEGMLSLPGSDQQKKFLINCTSCHPLQRIMTSSHNAEEFLNVFKRMGTYSPGSTPARPQPLLPGPRGERAPVSPQQAKDGAPYLESVSLGNPDAQEYSFKFQARPTG